MPSNRKMKLQLRSGRPSLQVQEVLVEIVVEFVGFSAGIARQRMHDHRVGFAVLGVDGFVEAEAAAVEIGLGLVAKALLLNAGQVNRVIVAQTFLHVVGLDNRVALASQTFDNFSRHSQFFRRHQREMQIAVEAQQFAERMYGTAVLEIADYSDF